MVTSSEITANEPKELSVYRERSYLIAYLASEYPHHYFMPDDAEEGFCWVICIHLPVGHVTWHLADSDLDLFDIGNNNIGTSDWDGHTSQQKYDRLHRLTVWGKAWIK